MVRFEEAWLTCVNVYPSQDILIVEAIKFREFWLSFAGRGVGGLDKHVNFSVLD